MSGSSAEDIPADVMERAAAPVTLEKCPIGLFVPVGSDELCLKTEYGNNEGRIDAFIVSSGEFFWGAQPQTIASQRKQMVVPYDHALALLTERREAEQRGIERAAKWHDEVVAWAELSLAKAVGIDQQDRWKAMVREHKGMAMDIRALPTTAETGKEA